MGLYVGSARARARARARAVPARPSRLPPGEAGAAGFPRFGPAIGGRFE